jgi:hypothetical protein
MHPLVRSTIAEARRRGFEFTLEKHLAAVMDLEQAARDTDSGSIQEKIDWLDRPVVIGTRRPVELRPLSLAGKLWLDELEQQGWFAGDALLETLACAWVLANSRDLVAIAAAGTTERQTRRTILRWARRIDCPVRAITAAVRHIMLPPREADAVAPQTAREARREAGNGCVGEILARLVHEFGKDFNYWLSAPWREVEAALSLLRKDAEAMSKAVGKAGARDPQSPEVIAFCRWREARGRFLRLLCPPAAQQPDEGAEHQQAPERTHVPDPPEQQQNNNRVHEQLPPVMS